jgi:hypothetical protein
MAALEPTEPTDPEEARLKTMVETMYLSKNKELKGIARTMDTAGINGTLLELIQSDNWHDVDGYFRGMLGVDNFLHNLQQLLIFKYRGDVSITRKQFQIALGIQQMIWMTDPANCLLEQNATSLFMARVPRTRLLIWEQIENHEREIIVSELVSLLSPRYRDGTLTSDFLNGTVWYSVEVIRQNMWSGFGSEKQYYPLPETLNFTSIANIYAPELVFGILGDITLTKHIAKMARRPYIANLPTKGLCEVHNAKYYICNVWLHDFKHTSGHGGRKVADYELEAALPFQNWLRNHPQYKDPAQLRIAEKTLTGEDLLAIKAIRFARGVNDTGSYFQPIVPVEGGKKRASRRARSRTRRPIAASRTARRVASRLSVRNTHNNTLSVPR